MSIQWHPKRKTKQELLAEYEKHKARTQEALEVLKTNKCPTCGSAIRRNMALTGWIQCVQLGAVGFRADSSKPSCDYQAFTV